MKKNLKYAGFPLAFTQMKCDCCGKHINRDQYLKLVLPIIRRGENDNELQKHEMDICAECANQIAQLYYRIAKENGSTGLFAIGMSLEDEP